MKIKIKTLVGILLIATIISIIFIYYAQNKNDHPSKEALINPVKVFQIGFSKCGTNSIAYFFYKHGISTVHHDAGQLPWSINENYKRKLPLISPRYYNIYVFSDMEAIYMDPQIKVAQLLFKELDKQYPGSKFILNTRNKEAWLKSRSQQPIDPDGVPLLKISADILKISTDEMLEQWSKEWDEHHIAVLEYFKDRPEDLLVFDIDKDGPEKFCEFFKNNFKLSINHWTKKNDSAYSWVRNRLHKTFGLFS